MGAGTAVNFSDLPEGAKVLSAPSMEGSYSDLPEGAKVLPGNAPGPVTISADPGSIRHSPGYDYSRGYAGAGDAQRSSGGFLDRASKTFGDDLSHPSSFLPSWHALLGPPGEAYDIAKEGWDQWSHRNDPKPDPAAAVGHMGVPLLTAAAIGALSPEPVPIRVRPEPAWRAAPSESAPVPSILNRQPHAQAARSRPLADSTAPPVTGDPILNRLRSYASQIAEEGHGDELEATPETINLNEDLTPALKASLRKVRAAKRIARSTVQ